MELTIDLYQTAAELRENIRKYLRVIPDDTLLMGVQHFEDAEELTAEEADEMVRAGLTQFLIMEIRLETERRAEQICNSQKISSR